MGYKGYLTINDMGETHGFHTAILLNMTGEKWFVDVGFPLYTTIPIANALTISETEFHQYRATPLGENRYLIA